MKTLVLLSIILAVALGRPSLPQGVEQNPVLPKDGRNPLGGDWVPVQGHVVVEDPAPQVRPEVQPEPELKDGPGAKVEKEVKENSEVKVEPEVQPKPEVKVEPEIKVEPDVNVENDVQLDQDVDVKPEVNPEVLAELKVEEKPEVKDNPEFKEESDVKVAPEDMEGKEEIVGEPVEELEPLNKENVPEEKLSVKATFQNQIPVNQPLPEEKTLITRKYALDGEPHDEMEEDPEVMADLKVDVKPEFRDDPEFKVEADVQEETQPEMLSEEEEFHVQMNPEAEAETGEKLEVTHIDLQRNNEMVGEPIMELEPLEDDNDFVKKLTNEELPDGERKYEIVGDPVMELEPLEEDNPELSEEEKSLRAPFQKEEEELMRQREYILAGEPIMELEPLTDDSKSEEKQSSKDGEHEMVGEPVMELEPLNADNVFDEELSHTENQDPALQSLPEDEDEEGLMKERVLNEEPIMEVKSEEEEQDMPDPAVMAEGLSLDTMGQPVEPLDEFFPDGEARRGMESLGEEQLPPMALFDTPGLYGGVGEARDEEGFSPKHYKQGWRHCPGVILEGKCFQFFRGPQSAADAEFFCQHQFTGGHLASITSRHIHRQVMNMMLRQNGVYTHTWIGALRYLETGSFIWLDGSRWGYADWLPGEPNNAEDVEKCVALLPNANGKFNDSSCLKAQAFICSYPY